MEEKEARAEVRLTHGAMSSKCHSNSDLLNSSSCVLLPCVTSGIRGINVWLSAVYQIRYEQFNSVQCLKWALVNGTGCLNTPSVFKGEQ